MVMTKTDIIKQMFREEFPMNVMLKTSLYKEQDSPFRYLRKGLQMYAGITRTNQNAANGVSFFDPELDIDELDRFIKTLAPDDTTLPV